MIICEGQGGWPWETRRWQAVSVADPFQEWLDLALYALIVERQRPINELLAAYDDVEREATRLLQASPPPDRLLSVRRELACLRLVAAKQRGARPELARQLFDACEQLGYASTDAQLNVTAVFARFCLESGELEFEKGELERVLRSSVPGQNARGEQLARELADARRRAAGEDPT
jgi:hypothetical protein